MRARHVKIAGEDWEERTVWGQLYVNGISAAASFDRDRRIYTLCVGDRSEPARQRRRRIIALLRSSHQSGGEVRPSVVPAVARPASSGARRGNRGASDIRRG